MFPHLVQTNSYVVGFGKSDGVPDHNVANICSVTSINARKSVLIINVGYHCSKRSTFYRWLIFFSFHPLVHLFVFYFIFVGGTETNVHIIFNAVLV